MTAMPTPTHPMIIPPRILLRAYRDGIFPMADGRDNPDIFWVEPRRRAILPLDGFHCSRSLARALRRGRFIVTCNQAFDDMLAACAAPRTDSDNGETWINAPLVTAYRALHRAGHAHSVEVWHHQGDERTLAGGLYGVGFDRVFCGESMFSRATDTSKIALAWLVATLRLAGAELLDCQFMTEHLRSLGAIEVSQAHYRRHLRHAQRVTSDQWEGARPLPEAFAALLDAAAAAGLSSSPGKFIAQSFTQTS